MISSKFSVVVEELTIHKRKLKKVILINLLDPWIGPRARAASIHAWILGRAKKQAHAASFYAVPDGSC